MMRFDEVLREAAQKGATDIFLVPGAVPCMNVDGVYVPMDVAKGHRMSPDQMIEFARTATTEKQWQELNETLELNMAYMSQDTGRFRINMFWQRGSIGLVARRVVDRIPTMRQLGLPPRLRGLALEDRGIILVTGSTGSGKSTTLASLIDYRNHLLPGHIVTIEDPVEFIYRHRRSIVTQREVGIDTESFHEALKNTLRQAPQVILIGELRDAETVQFAMHASETGHLVFATLHSTNAPLTIERMLHFYPGEMKEQVQIQLSLNLRAIVCQRLVHRVGGGRVAAVELLINTPRMQDLIAKGEMSGLKQLLAAENQEGIIHFDKFLYRLHKQGKISYEDALQAADSANDLQIKFKGIGIQPGSSWEDVADPWQSIRGDYEFPEDSPELKRAREAARTAPYDNEGAPALPPPQRRPPSGNMAPSHSRRPVPADGTGPVQQQAPRQPSHPQGPPAQQPPLPGIDPRRQARPHLPPGAPQAAPPQRPGAPPMQGVPRPAMPPRPGSPEETARIRRQAAPPPQQRPPQNLDDELD